MVKVCSVILIRFCMIYAYTRLRYQVSVYRTIGPLVFLLSDEGKLWLTMIKPSNAHQDNISV